MRVAFESTAVAAEGCGLAGDQGTANPRGDEQMEAKETPLYWGGEQLSVASEPTAVVTEYQELTGVLSHGMSSRDDLKVAKVQLRNCDGEQLKVASDFSAVAADDSARSSAAGDSKAGER